MMCLSVCCHDATRLSHPGDIFSRALIGAGPRPRGRLHRTARLVALNPAGWLTASGIGASE